MSLQPLNRGQKTFALAAPMLVPTKNFRACGWGVVVETTINIIDSEREVLPSSRHHRAGIYAIEVSTGLCRGQSGWRSTCGPGHGNLAIQAWHAAQSRDGDRT